MAAPFVLRSSTLRGAHTLRGPGVAVITLPRPPLELPGHLFRRIPVLWQARGEFRFTLAFGATPARIAEGQGDTCWHLIFYGDATLLVLAAGALRLPALALTADGRIRRYTEPEDLRLLGLALELEEEDLVGV